METVNEKIDRLIEIIQLERKKDEKGVPYFDTTEGRMYQREELRKIFREVLEIDKQCSQCLDWNFSYDLSVIEDTNLLICSKCAEEIIGGGKQVIET